MSEDPTGVPETFDGCLFICKVPSFHLSLALDYLHLPSPNNVRQKIKCRSRTLKLDTEKICKDAKSSASGKAARWRMALNLCSWKSGESMPHCKLYADPRDISMGKSSDERQPVSWNTNILKDDSISPHLEYSSTKLSSTDLDYFFCLSTVIS